MCVHIMCAQQHIKICYRTKNSLRTHIIIIFFFFYFYIHIKSMEFCVKFMDIVPGHEFLSFPSSNHKITFMLLIFAHNVTG